MSAIACRAASALYPVPPSVGVRTDYRYAVVNNRRLIVDPSTREVVYVIQ